MFSLGCKAPLHTKSPWPDAWNVGNVMAPGAAPDGRTHRKEAFLSPHAVDTTREKVEKEEELSHLNAATKLQDDSQ